MNLVSLLLIFFTLCMIDAQERKVKFLDQNLAVRLSCSQSPPNTLQWCETLYQQRIDNGHANTVKVNKCTSSKKSIKK